MWGQVGTNGAQGMKATQALFIFEDQLSEGESESRNEASSQDKDHEEAKPSDTLEEVELSLNARLVFLRQLA